HVSWSELGDILSEAGAKMPDGAEEGTWPVSLLHGDLSPGNMIVGRDNQLFIIDWEKCGAGPVAWDLKKLFLSEQHLVCQLLQALNGPGDLEPRAQINLVVAVEIVHRRRDHKRKLAQHLDGGKQRNFALQLLKAREENLLAAIGGRYIAPSYR